MISIQPKWCGKIYGGVKNLEFRKTVPKLPVPFKAFLYCTTGKDTLSSIIKDGEDIYGETYHGKPIFIKYDRDCPAEFLGKKKTVVGEVTIDRIEEVTIRFDKDEPEAYYGEDKFTDLIRGYLLSGGITIGEYLKYKGNGKVYGWHIADWTLYKEPKKLEDFGLKHPPQSWCYVETEVET